VTSQLSLLQQLHQQQLVSYVAVFLRVCDCACVYVVYRLSLVDRTTSTSRPFRRHAINATCLNERSRL